MKFRISYVTVFAALVALAGCGQKPVSAPPATTTSTATAPSTADPNVAQLAYLVAQHSPLLDEAARTAISQDFNGAPLSAAAMRREVKAENVRCRAVNPPTGTPECSVTYTAGKVVEITGEDATALFAALAAANVRDNVSTGQITRELTALQCSVDDAAAQGTPATGDQIAGFSCQFTPAP